MKKILFKALSREDKILGIERKWVFGLPMSMFNVIDSEVVGNIYDKED